MKLDVLYRSGGAVRVEKLWVATWREPAFPWGKRELVSEEVEIHWVLSGEARWELRVNGKTTQEGGTFVDCRYGDCVSNPVHDAADVALEYGATHGSPLEVVVVARLTEAPALPMTERQKKEHFGLKYWAAPYRCAWMLADPDLAKRLEATDYDKEYTDEEWSALPKSVFLEERKHPNIVVWSSHSPVDGATAVQRFRDHWPPPEGELPPVTTAVDARSEIQPKPNPTKEESEGC